MTTRLARNLILLALLSLAGLLLITEPRMHTSAASALPPGCNPNPTCAGSTCPTSITAALATVPADACSRHGEFQSDVDVFSWNEFIALNWPATAASCAADRSKSILSGQSPVVWETYLDDSDVFVASGPTSPWCPSTHQGLQAKLAKLPPETRASAGKLGFFKIFDQQQKVSQRLVQRFPDISQAFNTGPLTDQNGRFVRYEKKLNRDEDNYLVSANIWNLKGQQSAGAIAFPQGPKSMCGTRPCGVTGAVEIKAAWKVLNPAEIASKRFYMEWAYVFNNANSAPSPGPNPVRVGLVGLHIIHKTQSQGTWFWSTFEQVSNTSSSFYNPKSTTPPNTQTAKQPWTELNPQKQPINTPTQVTRQVPIEPAQSLNDYYRHTILKGSVWENYQLITTQWATGGAPNGTPATAANVTMETYFGASSSCFQCHKGAVNAAKKNADFSWLLLEAQ